MAEPPMLDGAANCIMPPVLMGVTTKLVGAFGTCAWATPKHKREKSKMRLPWKLIFNRLSIMQVYMFVYVCFATKTRMNAWFYLLN
jgi:hypothetical protein